MLAYVALAVRGWWVPALLVFLLGYVGLIVAIHDLCHRALKLSPKANQWWLSILGVMGEVSGSAIQATHLVHHRIFSAAFAGHLSDGEHVYDHDPETAFGGLPLWRAMALSPFYQLSLWRWTRQQRQALRRRTIAEAGFHFLLGILSVALIPWTIVPVVYAVGVFICGVIFPLVSARIFHDVDSVDALESTRSLRGPMPWLTMGLADHLEHHLYPSVPSIRARTLAKRIEAPLAALRQAAVSEPSSAPISNPGTTTTH
jgi:fatty acid desaturase